MIYRELTEKLVGVAKKFPSVAVLGPRQSGKTTLVRAIFPNYTYITFEDLDVLNFAQKDPRNFLESYKKEPGLILDEIQNVPTLFSYLQTAIDAEKKPGFFILTGSHNFLLNQAISQTLAGRIAILTLLPLSIYELKKAKLLQSEPEELIFTGGYPRIYDEDISPLDWYPNYIRTYIERDVRLIKNISDLALFQRFLKLCAGRIGQLVNLASLCNDCGISIPTAKAWLSVLEASYIILLLQPHYRNFSKRLVKTPKLFFYDTGVACSLLEIDAAKQINSHYLRGGLFESLIISDLLKYQYNRGRIPHYYFWRDKHGHEIDCLIEQAQRILAIEIKAGKTITQSYFKGLEYWKKLSGNKPKDSFVIYAGNENQIRSQGSVTSWDNVSSIFK